MGYVEPRAAYEKPMYPCSKLRARSEETEAYERTRFTVCGSKLGILWLLERSGSDVLAACDTRTERTWTFWREWHV